MSHLKSYGSLFATSGAMKPLVPSFFTIKWPGYSLKANPRSPTLMRGLSELSLRKMFIGLRSLWTRCWACMSLTPSAIYMNICLTCSSVNQLSSSLTLCVYSRLIICSKRSPPAASLVTKKISSFRLNFSIKLTTYGLS